MIHRAHFRNFKALRDLEIGFDSRLTVLVGPNGSGKTSILQGIHFLTQLAREANADPEYQFQHIPDYFSLGAPDKADDSIAFHHDSSTRQLAKPIDDFQLSVHGKKPWGGADYGINVSMKETAVRLKLARTSKDGQQHNTQLAEFRWANGQIHELKNRERNPGTMSENFFDSSAFVRFSARQLAAPIVDRASDPPLRRDGAGLAALLIRIRNNNEECFHLIEKTFTRVISNAKKIRFEQEPVPESGGILGYTLLIDFEGAEGVKARHLSSGTLFALGLLAVLFGSSEPSVILLDDLDHGLHPRAQMELVDMFRIVLTHRNQLQIIATCHSPFILNKLKWNEVRVTSLLDDRSAICKPLSEHPLYPRWKESMSPGEFWSFGGEEWVKNGKPELAAP